MRRPAGFTAIELLGVVAIIGILAVIAIPSYQLMRKNVALSSYTQEIVSALRVAQNRSISSQGGMIHGVHFESDRYVVYDGTWPSSNSQVHMLENGVEILTGAPEEVEFERLMGGTLDHADYTFQIGFPGGRSKTITVNASGRISS